jgi:hypothetical protein
MLRAMPISFYLVYKVKMKAVIKLVILTPKLHRLQDPSVENEDNLSNVKREASRHFRNKKGNI